MSRENGKGGLLVPLDHLFVVVLVAPAPSIRVNETTKRVSSEIGAMRVHLPSPIIRLEVRLCLVDETDDLGVVRSLHELDALESTTGDKARAMARLGTPCDGLMLCFTNGCGASRRGPNTEI